MKAIYLAIVWILASQSILHAQDATDYSKFKGTKVKSQMTARVDAPFFKSYGSEYFKHFVKMNVANRNVFTGGPEEILFMVYKATSDKELKAVAGRKTKVDVKSYKQTFTPAPDTARNFLLLRHKLTFAAKENEVAMIKYTEYVDSAATRDYLIVLRNEKKQWLIAATNEFADVAFVVLSVTSGEFMSLHKKDMLTADDEPVAQDVIARIKDDDGVLNLSKLATVIRERKSQGKSSVK